MADSGRTADEVAQRLRLRYAKRGRMRFASHRDFARAFERALRRSALPVAFSGGFNPRPRVSYVGAAPTGVASEAEYLELGLVRPVALAEAGAALAASLPDGFAVLAVVDAATQVAGSLANRIDASRWEIALLGADSPTVAAAVDAFLAAPAVSVERLTKDGRRTMDVRAAVVSLAARAGADGESSAILEAVVRHMTPTVRPNDLVTGVVRTSGLEPPGGVRATRLAQGRLLEDGTLADPLGDEVSAS